MVSSPNSPNKNVDTIDLISFNLAVHVKTGGMNCVLTVVNEVVIYSTNIQSRLNILINSTSESIYVIIENITLLHIKPSSSSKYFQ